MSDTVIDPTAFRRVCAKFATGITVVTALSPDETPHGMTVNSFASVSLAPPLALVCVDLRATLLPLLRPGNCFAVNVLREDQKNLSNQFAQKGGDRFDGVPWVTGATGVPLLRDALATFELKVVRLVEAGDHAVVIGEVLHLHAGEGRPLLYFDSRYQILG